MKSMISISEYIETRGNNVEGHAFYQWLEDTRVPAQEKFIFAPVFVNFIMGFSDMNKWFMRYDNPTTVLEHVLNEHTDEDQTHSRLFLNDWKKLGLNEVLKWSPSETLQWYYAGEDTEIFRAYGLEIMKMCVLFPEPELRFGYMEAIEECGHIFFSRTCPVALELSKSTGLDYKYFGPYHLARETGHLQADTDQLENIPMDSSIEEIARKLVDHIFQMFEIENTRLLKYAQSKSSVKTNYQLLSEDKPDVSYLEKLRDRRFPKFSYPYPSEVSGIDSIEKINELFDRRKRQVNEHPLFVWLLTDKSKTSKQKLQYLSIIWAPDFLGYRDLNKYVFRYHEASTSLQKLINEATLKLETHHQLFFQDWNVLGLDDWLGWNASQTIHFYCLHPFTETQRKNFAQFITLAFRYSDPSIRYWLLLALEETGDPFFRTTNMLAKDCSGTRQRKLPYLMGEDQKTNASMIESSLTTDAKKELAMMSREQMEITGKIIATVFDSIEEQYTLSLQLFTDGDFEKKLRIKELA